ncbi:MAG: hypothetical protein C4326_05420 [Ignavibacteria bacterium]|mgnify:CR=1 FL=1
MRRSLVLLACVAMLAAASFQYAAAHPRPHQAAGVTFAVFYDGLSPYGEWISIGAGIYGWRPIGVAVGWRPYTVGRWCWTVYGWYWVSDEPWGWAVFHYGRWYYDDFYGWIWIPGYDWAPAWVEWRYGGDYIGWAPLGPYAVFSIHWGIHYRTRWYTPIHWWSFVHCRYIAVPNVHRFVYRTEQNTRYIGMTRSGGSVRYSGGRIVSRGPEPEYVERRGNVRLSPVRVQDANDARIERIVKDDGRERIEVYRPQIVEQAEDDAASVRPSRLRAEGGRSLELDTRKIDLRAREESRIEGRHIRRADEYRTRDDGMLKGPVDDAIRNRTGRTGEADRRIEAEPGRDDARDGERSRTRDIPGQAEKMPERDAVPQRDGRERKREEGVQRPPREDIRMPLPDRPERKPEYRMPERRSEPPRRDGVQQHAPPRSEGGRSGRGR